MADGMSNAVLVMAPLAIAVVVIATMLGLGADVTQDLYNAAITNTSTQVSNQTIIASNVSNTTLRGQLLEQGTLLVYNTTNTTGAGALNSSDLIAVGNYTSSRNPPTFRLTAPQYNGSNLSLTYTYVNTTVPLSAAAYQNGTLGLGNVSDYLPEIGTLGAAAAIIAALGVAFVLGRRT